MSFKHKWARCERLPAVRVTLLGLGVLLIVCSPLFGVLPGPGGILVFAAGLGLVLRYSGWAKRKYVHFKRRHPSKAAWTDWGMRRPSAKRRVARDRDRLAQETRPGD
jgi:hypothetical protein